MSDEKTYVFGEPSSMDSNALLAMMNNGGFGNNAWIWIIFLFFLGGWRGNGFGNNVDSSYGTQLLMQAINGNGNAVGQLATTLNSDINSVQTAINGVQSSIQNVGANVGLTGQQVINSIQLGNQTLASQLAQCCCDNKLLVTTQGYENQIATLNQTNALQGTIAMHGTVVGDKIDALATTISDKFGALEMRELQAKIDSLTEEKNSLKNSISVANQTTQIQSYINGLVGPLSTEVSAIKAAMPQTITLPYPQAIAVPYNSIYGYNTYNGNIWS